VNDRTVFHDEQAVARRQNRGEARSYVLEGRPRIDASSADCTSKQEGEWTHRPIGGRFHANSAHRLEPGSSAYPHEHSQGYVALGLAA
jgi:hypothetical protein